VGRRVEPVEPETLEAISLAEVLAEAVADGVEVLGLLPFGEERRLLERLELFERDDPRHALRDDLLRLRLPELLHEEVADDRADHEPGEDAEHEPAHEGPVLL